MLSVVLASDLDRTLIHPTKTLPPAFRADAEVAEYYQGRGITVASARTLNALHLLAASGALVPVTTRSRAQLERVSAVWQLVQDGWAICANGATVLHNGIEDPDWRRTVEATIDSSAPLAEARSAFEQRVGSEYTAPWLDRLRDCDGRFLYATLGLDQMPSHIPQLAHDTMAALQWRAVLHGRKLYLMPQALCKGRATAWLRDKLEIEHMITAGDSLLDVELLGVGDESWCPRDAELVALDAVPDGVRLTDAGHVRAGDQIAGAAVERLRRMGGPGD